MASKFAYAARDALRSIGRPARIPEILRVIEEDIGLDHDSVEPEQTLRNEIRKNCGSVDHPSPGNAYLIFTNPRRGYYGLTEWDDKAASPVDSAPPVPAVPATPQIPSLPEEIPTEDAPFVEGAAQEVRVNRYERDPRARQACLDHWGTTCSVCSMSFAKLYGPLGEGFIHVHHLLPLSELGEDYEIDPVKDMRPVCPNCHAMLHCRRPPLLIEELVVQMGETARAANHRLQHTPEGA
jgi:hypothetical protein